MKRTLFTLLFLTSNAFGLEGRLRSWTDYYPTDLGPPTETVVPRLGIELDHAGHFTKTWKFSFKGHFETNLQTKSQPEKAFGDLSELLIEYKKKSFRARVGYDTVNWGVLDLYSPMDVVNSRVYFEPLDSLKRGAPGLNFAWNPGGWTIAGVYIPWQPPPVFPSNDSRWYPRELLLNLQTEQGQMLLPRRAQYTVGHAVELNHALQNNFGLKIDRHWSAVDLHLMHFEGDSESPSARIHADLTTVNLFPLTAQVTGPIGLQPLFYRTRTTGLGWSAALNQIIIRGETTYTDSLSPVEGQAFSAWSWQNGVGVEKNWDVSDGTLTTLLHYYKGLFPHSADNLPTSSLRLFDDTFLLGARLGVTDDRFFYASVLYNQTQEGLFWILGVQTKFRDKLRFDLSWRDISAQRIGLLKTYDKNDHARIELTYFF